MVTNCKECSFMCYCCDNRNNMPACQDCTNSEWFRLDKDFIKHCPQTGATPIVESTTRKPDWTVDPCPYLEKIDVTDSDVFGHPSYQYRCKTTGEVTFYPQACTAQCKCGGKDK